LEKKKDKERWQNKTSGCMLIQLSQKPFFEFDDVQVLPLPAAVTMVDSPPPNRTFGIHLKWLLKGNIFFDLK
jgi:hypothetical protein